MLILSYDSVQYRWRYIHISKDRNSLKSCSIDQFFFYIGTFLLVIICLILVSLKWNLIGRNICLGFNKLKRIRLCGSFWWHTKIWNHVFHTYLKSPYLVVSVFDNISDIITDRSESWVCWKEQFISISLVTPGCRELDDVTRETKSEVGVASHDRVVTEENLREFNVRSKYNWLFQLTSHYVLNNYRSVQSFRKGRCCLTFVSIEFSLGLGLKWPRFQKVCRSKYETYRPSNSVKKNKLLVYYCLSMTRILFIRIRFYLSFLGTNDQNGLIFCIHNCI